MNKKYSPRIADFLLLQRLEEKGAILIEGTKWCGKTTTAAVAAHSAIYMQDPMHRQQNIEAATTAPNIILGGKTPRLIDEWQIAPQLWDAVRFEVDKRAEFGQFILTGSATPPDTTLITHTGTGRIGRLLMRPMTLAESGESSQEVSLANLFNDTRSLPDLSGTNPCTLEDIAFLTARGGWPLAVGKNDRVALAQARDYVDAVVHTEIQERDGSLRSPQRARRLMRSLARHIATSATIETIRRDVIASDSESFGKETLYSYLDALKNTFVFEEMTAWNPNLRSKTAIRQRPTHFFADPSIATASLGISPQALLENLETFGLIFENLVVRDLRVYAQALGGEVSHYRDASGLECDAVVHLPDGRYGLVEIKLGGDARIEEGAESLRKLVKKIDTERMGEPRFLMVVTANSPYAFQRRDGVLVVPVATLAP